MPTSSVDEISRLKALRDLAILDTEAEESFDDLTRAAARVCDVPIALISLVDDERQWFKSRVGVEARQTPREIAFCAHAIQRPGELLEVPDATRDERFRANPLVTSDPSIRFYAGAPLVDDDGHTLGTLCVIDRQPRALLPWQREVLQALARTVMRMFNARAAVKRLSDSSQAHRLVELRAATIASVPVGSVLVLPDGGLQPDEATCAMTGYRAEELADVGRWFNLLYRQRAETARSRYDQDRAAGFPSARVTLLRRQDGSRRQVEFNGVNSPRGEMWLLRDVTATVGAEERFRVLFERSSDAHLLLDDLGIFDCNQAAVAMLGGTDKEQLLGLHPARFSPEFQPDGRRSAERVPEIDEVVRRQGHHRFEWSHRRLDGRDIPVEVSVTQVQLAGGPVMLVVWHDLSELKRAEEAERLRERRWLLALEASGDGVWDWNLDTDEVFYSPRWKSMLGHAVDEIGGGLDEWARRAHPEDKERALAEVRRHLSGEVAQYVQEHRMLCKDGAWKWILARGMVTERHPDGRPRRLIGTHTDLTERRQMEERLRLEQERFRAMSEGSPVGIFVTDFQGQATYLNERWCALAGMSAAQALGMGWVGAVHPDDRLPAQERWVQAVRDGESFTNQLRFLHPGGRVVWITVMAAPMQVSGRNVGYVGTVSDVTASRLDEQRLRDSVARFDLVAAGAAIGIWEMRFEPAEWRAQFGDDLACYWSPRFSAVMGYEDEPLPPRLASWLRAIHIEDLDRTLAAIIACLERGAPFAVELRLRHRRGDYRWFQVTGEAERDAQGRPRRFAGSMADITPRKRDEELLQRARAQLLDAIGAVDAGFAMFDREDRLVVSNARLAAGYGMEPGRWAPGTAYRAMLEELAASGALVDVPEGPAAWIAERTAAHGAPGADREFLLAGRWMRLAERRTGDGGVVSLHTDVTALKQAAEDMRRARDIAEEAVKVKAEFLATMSHEIRTPMNGVIGMTTLLLDTALTPQQREYAGTVRTCGENLLALINGILDFSKIEAGSLSLERIPFSPRRLVEDALAVLADQAQKKGLELVGMIGSAVPGRVLGDPVRLRQVVLNLLSNAVKFTEHGEVVVTLERLADEGGRVRLALIVRDTGVGVPLEARDRLFRAFSQADSSTTRRFGGSGLGLVISQRLVQLMEGEIGFTSEVGRGTEFRCSVPFPVVEDAEEPLASPGLAGKRALVVGGHPLARQALREHLVAWGLACAEIGAAGELPAALLNGSPDLIVVDHAVPGGALEVCRTIATHAWLAGKPKVLMAPTGLRDLAKDAQVAGFAGFLSKPLRREQLFDCLLGVLEQRSRTGAQRSLAAQQPFSQRLVAADGRAPVRVLVVEDNPVNRQVAVGILTKLGCRCDVAADGAEAVAATAAQDYAVVFMDCQMPVLDGYDATLAIRRREGDGRRTPIVALTANALDGDRERCLAAGMDDYISKPIRVPDLTRVLERAHAAGGAPPAAAPAPVPVPASAPGPEDARLIDDAALRSLLAATDGATLVSVVQMMRKDAVSAVAELRRAAAARDAAALARLAHRMKGSTATLGLVQARRLCIELESVARRRDLDAAPRAIDALVAAFAAVMPALLGHPLVVGAAAP